MSDVAVALAEVRERIAAAARRAAREPADVTLVGAAKAVPAARLAEAVALGLANVGENRAQELLAKASALPSRSRPFGPGRSGPEAGPAVCWHFIGRLQRNKIRALAPWVTWWQSVDREPLGAELARSAAGARVLVEVNLGDEPQKGGCPPGETGRLVDTLRGLGLRVEGLMTIPPLGLDPRGYFAALRELAEQLGLAQLSMGMTDDFEVAIEEGATMVRIGRAIFGSRP